jgi:VWFA-related protein
MNHISGKTIRLAALCLMIAALLPVYLVDGVAAAGRQEDQQKIPYYRAETRLVAIPVYVTGTDGKPVKGLSAADFEVREGRNTCKINSVEFIDYMQTTADAYAIIPPESRRQFLLLFDLSFSNITGIRKAQQAGYEFLTKKTSPNDLLAVATISGRGGIRLICPFGAGRAQAAYAISTLELGNQLVYRDPAGFAFDDVLKSVESDILKQSESTSDSGLYTEQDSARAQNDLMAMEQLHEALKMAQRAEEKVYADLIGRYVSIFNALSSSMNAFHGRKNIVFFSEGFDQDEVSGLNMNELASQSEAWSTLSVNTVSSADISVRQSQQDILGTLKKVLNNFNQANTVFYVVDVSRFSEDSTAATGRRNTQGSLLQFADETNGVLYNNLNDLSVALNEIAEKTSAGYLVIFEPSKPGKPGEFRKVNISVKQPGLKVSHQVGYSFEKDYTVLSPAEKQLQLAEYVVKDIISNRIPFVFDAQVFDGNERLARLPVIIEIPGSELTDKALKRKADLIQIELYGYLLGEDNTPVDFFFDYIRFTTKEAIKNLSEGSIKYYNLLVAPPGNYKVKCIVRDSELGMISSNIRPINVPDFSKRELRFSGPIFIDLKSGWLNFFNNTKMQATGRRTGQPVEYPYLWGQRTLAPAINPVVSASMPDLVLFRCHGLDLSSGDPKVDVKFEIVDPVGNAVEIKPESLFDRKQDLTADTCDLIFQFHLASSNLKPGQYRLRMKLTDLLTNNSGAAEVPFVVQ